MENKFSADLNADDDNLSTLIGSHWFTGKGPQLVSTTPDAKHVLWRKNSSSTTQVIEAVNSAKSSQPQWQALPLDSRIELVKRFGELLSQNKEMICQIIVAETGKPLWEAQTEISACVNKIDISVRAQRERSGSMAKGRLSLSHRAHGVMGIFGPYNFPLHLPNGHIIPALLAGNTVVFKPSELTPRCAEVYADIWLNTGLPPGVFNLVQGGAEVGEALVDTTVDGILFTGSYRTGQIIHQKLAGRPETLLALEMGGNNPMIVGEISNLDIAANTILHSAYLSAGQRCTCTRRLIVVENQQTEQLLEKLTTQIGRMILSNQAEDKTPFMGPVINQHAADRILAAQARWIDNGAKSLSTMASTDDSGVYLSAGLIDVTDVAQLEDEEYFGPLLQLVRVADFDAALAKANATQYGLAAGLLSDNADEQSQFKQCIRAGVISINMPTAGASSELPFGGIGHSGNHRPSAYYAADYCAWPQALSEVNTEAVSDEFNIDNIRGLR